VAATWAAAGRPGLHAGAGRQLASARDERLQGGHACTNGFTGPPPPCVPVAAAAAPQPAAPSPPPMRRRQHPRSMCTYILYSAPHSLLPEHGVINNSAFLRAVRSLRSERNGGPSLLTTVVAGRAARRGRPGTLAGPPARRSSGPSDRSIDPAGRGRAGFRRPAGRGR